MGGIVVFIGICLLVALVCGAIAGGIDMGQTEIADKNVNEFLNNIDKMCKDYNINFQEPMKIKNRSEIGYYYTYKNAVCFEDEQGIIDPALYWIDVETLCFVGNTGCFKIQLDKIKMYTCNGEIKYNSLIKNNGKGVSITGAVVGGILAGAPGMILGGTKDRNNIETEIEEKDERIVYVYYTDDIDNKIKMFSVQSTSLSYNFEFYAFLKKNVPTKDYGYLMQFGEEKQEEKEKNSDVEEKLIKIKKLYEQGLINENDYKEKKKKILEDL